MWPSFLRADQVEPAAKFLRGTLAAMALAGLHVPHDTKIPAGAEYDFIVVGAGTAGSIVASRLAEGPARVLLLEAGGSPPVHSQIPGLFPLIPGSEFDWKYKAHTNSSVCRAHKGPIDMVRGKMLGGSSAANYMHHVLGHPTDYDEWAAVAGHDGWAYSNMAQLIKKMESVHDDDILNSKYGSLRGRNGNIKVTRQVHREQTLKYFKAFFELGHRISHDYNTGPLPSFSEGQFTIGGGRRSSSAAYLVPPARRPNLTVVTHAHVERVLFEGDKAVAVEVTTENGEPITIKAKAEIILSAGAINTPLILMRSGIGPRDHLEEFGIAVLANLPVGYNLQDHNHVPIILTGGNSIKPDPTTLHEFPLPAILGFVSLNETSHQPDYEVMGYPVARGSKNLLLMCHSFGLRDEICNRFDDAAALQETFLANIMLLHPESRGRVRLTADSKAPGIYLGYYDVEQDLERHATYLEDYLRVLNTTYFRGVRGRPVDLKLEECAGEEFGSRGYWVCYARNMVTTTYHPVGTAALGAVLDARLRVRGTRRLRVADASAIPTLPSGNINAPVALLAEYAAQLVKEDHGFNN